MEMQDLCEECGQKCCRTCGEFGGKTILLKREVKEIEDNTEFRDFYEEEKVGNESFYRLLHKDKRCVLLSKDGLCKVYKYRPFDCKYYPLLFSYTDGKITLLLSLRCPYAKKIPKDTLEKAKQDMIDELKNWSGEELKGWGGLMPNEKVKEI